MSQHAPPWEASHASLWSGTAFGEGLALPYDYS